MINALFKVIFGLIEIIVRFLWWIIITMICGSTFGKIVALFILILIIGGVNR
jgi:hypothetical protein